MDNKKKPISLLLLFLSWLMNLTLVVSSSSICPTRSAKDYILGFPNETPAPLRPRFIITKGDERWLQVASDMIHKNECDYVALLFYASWCPFSRSFRPSFGLLSLFYSSIPHFAIEESSVRASTLSKYGVRGFPTIILFNSTMRTAYRGSRTLFSLVEFYSDVTGIETLDETLPDKNGLLLYFGNPNNIAPENCPVSWARRSPENIFRQETYLALATVFVLLRLLHLISPTIVTLAKFTWRRVAQSMRLGNTVAMYFKEPSMSSNLQEGALNARAWASKSLATVSIGDSTSSSRGVSASQ